ncbi:MAG: FliM/FliN family flagellar motor switch protein [Myxococcota bacterium]|nr:FliM/FliN family flagellar motor switch protein [Myxococcota bacterium]
MAAADPESQSSVLIQPDRETASILPALEDLFREAARDVRTRLVNRAGSDIPVRLGLAQVTTLSGVLDDTDARDGGVFGLFRFMPMGLPGIFVVQGRLLSRIVGVLLGENPGADPAPYRIRPVTRVELRFARRIVEDVLGSLADAWPQTPRPTLELESIGPGPRLADSLTPTTPVIAGSLDFGSPESPYGLLTVAIPGQAARDLRVPKTSTIPKSLRTRRYKPERVLPINVDAVAELGRIRMTMRELEALRVGQELDIGSDREARLRVGEKVLYIGDPGRHKGRHSLKIVRKAGEEDE